MSIMLVHAALAQGARVGVMGRSKEHLHPLGAAGADKVFSSLDEGFQEAIRAWANGRGPDHVFEAVGKAETSLLAVDLVRDGGKVCLFGGCAQGTTVPYDVHKVHYKQIMIQGVFHHTPRHFGEAVRLLSEGKVKTELLIQGSVKLADIPAFFAANADKSIPKRVVTA